MILDVKENVIIKRFNRLDNYSVYWNAYHVLVATEVAFAISLGAIQNDKKSISRTINRCNGNIVDRFILACI